MKHGLIIQSYQNQVLLLSNQRSDEYIRNIRIKSEFEKRHTGPDGSWTVHEEENRNSRGGEKSSAQ